ncbi:MAG: hypothetical protein GY898_31125 [Proteobacteria bacterium]|nr:hypothetical protein [Pseudomonadota bacterium]
MEATRRDLLIDSALLAAVACAAAASFVLGTSVAELAGDAFLPFECGWRSLTRHRLAQPGQGIFGYGVCLTGVLNLLGADTLEEVARNRALLHVTTVPLVWLAVRSLAPTLTAAGPGSARLGATAVAAILVRSPAIIDLITAGTKGYYAVPWLALALVCWARATQKPSPVLLAVGWAAAPMAVMNHPYALWIGAVGLVLLPGFLRTHGRKPVAAALVTAAIVTAPRLVALAAGLSKSGDVNAMVGTEQSVREPIAAIARQLSGFADRSMLVGLVGLIAVALLAPPAKRAGARLWAAAATAAIATVAVTAAILGYARSYHLMLLAPLGMLGLGVSLAGLSECWIKPSREPLACVWATILLAVVGATLASRPHRPWEPQVDLVNDWAAGARGASQAVATIHADAAKFDPDTKIVVSDLYIGDSARDTAGPISLGLLLAGLDRDKLSCCTLEDQPHWYWIVDKEVLDLTAVPSIEVLLGPPDLEEMIFVARDGAARSALRAAACEQARQREKVLASQSYQAWLSWMNHGLNRSVPIPPDPLDCSLSDEAPSDPNDPALTRILESPTSDEVRAILRSAPPLRGEYDPSTESRPVVIQIFSCEDPQIRESTDYFDKLEPDAANRAATVLSLQLAQWPEERRAYRGLPCGVEYGGGSRTVLVGVVPPDELEPVVGATPRALVYDHLGQLRADVRGPFVNGNESDQRIRGLLQRMHAEMTAATEDAARGADGG